MKRIFCLTISVILCVFSLCACIDRQTNSTVYETEEVTSVSEDTFVSFSPEDEVAEVTEVVENEYSYSSVYNQYPDKVILTWYMTCMFEDDIPDVTVINEYLTSLNCDFVLSLVVSDYSKGENAYESIATAIQTDSPPDIISTLMIDPAHGKNYESISEEGLLEPLDGYIEGTEMGNKILETFSPNYLSAFEINGSIYGLDGSFNYVFMTDGYYVNSSLADKYGWDISKSILEQIDILEDIRVNETECDIISNVQLQNPCFYSRSQYSGIAYDQANDYFYSPLNDNGYVEAIKTYTYLNSLEYIQTDTLELGKSCFIVTEFAPAGQLLYLNSSEIPLIYNEDTGYENYIPVFADDSCMITTAGIANGICSYSNNKDEAFELLAMLYTDSKLNNLFCYGVNSEEYDGRIMPSTNAWSYAFRFANMLMNDSAYSTYGRAADPMDKGDAYERVMQSINVPKCLGFSISEDLMLKRSKISEIINKHPFWEYDTAEESITALETKLKEAGIDELIDEINRQYSEWKESAE